MSTGSILETAKQIRIHRMKLEPFHPCERAAKSQKPYCSTTNEPAEAFMDQMCLRWQRLKLDKNARTFAPPTI